MPRLGREQAVSVAALATEDVVFDALELEQLQEVSEDRLHRSAPSVFW